jgi:hypothetical protein
MERRASLTEKRPDPVRLAVGLPVGEEGGYFVGAVGYRGNEDAPGWLIKRSQEAVDLVDYNYPPAGQPNVWCQWVPTEDRGGIEWDQGEKFSNYTGWLMYLIAHFLKPWGYVLSGTVEYRGRRADDFGRIVVKNNDVFVDRGRIQCAREG